MQNEQGGKLLIKLSTENLAERIIKVNYKVQGPYDPNLKTSNRKSIKL